MTWEYTTLKNIKKMAAEWVTKRSRSRHKAEGHPPKGSEATDRTVTSLDVTVRSDTDVRHTNFGMPPKFKIGALHAKTQKNVQRKIQETLQQNSPKN